MTETYTSITYAFEEYHLSQDVADTPEAALRKHLGRWPYDDGGPVFDDELTWLLDVVEGRAPVTLLPVGHCPGTWLWSEGALHRPQWSTYIVRTKR